MNSSVVTSLPEVKARWLFVFLLVALVTPVITVAFVWPEWLDSEGLPIPDSISGVMTYIVIGMLLYVSTLRRGVEDQFPVGSFPPREDAVAYTLLAIPLIGIACLGVMALYLPLSYVSPEFVKWWVLEMPPTIWWRPDAEAVFASILNVLVIVVLAPVVEEFLFRGFMLNRWLRKYGTLKAVALSSTTFALFHIEILGGFVFGVVLSLIYLRTRSLFGPIIVHITNNAIALLVIVSEGIATGEIHTLTLSEFRGYWWVAPVGAIIGVPWLMWFLKTKISRLEQCVA